MVDLNTWLNSQFLYYSSLNVAYSDILNGHSFGGGFMADFVSAFRNLLLGTRELFAGISEKFHSPPAQWCTVYFPFKSKTLVYCNGERMPLIVFTIFMTHVGIQIIS